MNFRKLSMFLTALIMLTSGSLTACSNTPVSADTQSESDKNAALETEVVTEQSYLDRYEGFDYNGETYTLAVVGLTEYPNYIGDPANGEPVNDAQYARDSWIEEQYNVDLQYVHYNDNGKMSADVQKQVKAGDTAYDCLQAGLNFDLCPMATAGVLADLYSIEELDLSGEWWSQNFNEEFTIANKLYMSTGPISFSYFYSPRLIAFNMRLIENYNLPNLYSVVDEGKWTLDYMYDLIKDFSIDLDGDGKMAENDLWGASVDEYSAAGFFLSAGGSEMEVDSEGKPYFIVQNAENVAIIDKVASIVGNADITQKAEPLSNKFGNGIVDKVYTFKNGNALLLGYGAQAIAFYLRDMEDDYGIIPVPKYDENQKEYITVGNPYVPAYIGIPMNNERGKINGVILNAMGYISRRDVQPLISDIMLKGKAARDETSQRMLDLIYSDIYLDLNCSYNFGDSFTLLRDITMGKKEGFSSGWAKLEKRAVSALDKLYEQIIANEE